MTFELPVAGSTPPKEREDAARNRERVVVAAAKLFRECDDPERVDMRAIAAEAGVGVGTLYRRFGDKVGLAANVLDDHARELQDAVISGPPPLGPGAPAEERLEAFLRALVDHMEKELDLVAAVMQLGGLGVGPYPAWRLHVRVLAAEIAPHFDPDWLADAILAPLSPMVYRHQRRVQGVPPEHIKAQLTQLARAVYGSRP
jgi:AcrR family transcriptional regulator